MYKAPPDHCREKRRRDIVTVYKAPPDHCRKKRCRDTDINQHCHHRNHCLHNVISNQCYLNLPKDMVENNPLDIENIKEKQEEDNELQQSATRHPEWYSRKTFSDVDNVLCYTKPGDDSSN